MALNDTVHVDVIELMAIGQEHWMVFHSLYLFVVVTFDYVDVVEHQLLHFVETRIVCLEDDRVFFFFQMIFTITEI